jgi:exodeoxyribonuclease VII large subunit
MAPPGAPEGAGASRASLGVAALLLAAQDVLAARFGAAAVHGELSAFTRAGSGHCYFTLKDADGAPALLRCAMFRRAAALLDFAPAEGQQVELRGRIAIYEARGELQLVVESMRRLGAGALYEEFLRRRARLALEGLFDAARKRPLPAFPQRVAVVTSLAAAALADVLAALARRSPHVAVLVVPCLVQGAEAPASIERALAAAAAQASVQLVLLVRGGGSLEDLWAFNDERVARAVAACRVPVVAGIGHESDVTLADLAADLRAATPTAAAEVAVPAAEEARRRLDHLDARLAAAVRRRLDAAGQRLDGLANRVARLSRRLGSEATRLAWLDRRLAAALDRAAAARGAWGPLARQRLAHAARQAIASRRSTLDTLEARLASLDPARVLARGYAWVLDARGAPVVSSAQVRRGDAIEAVWADGRVRAAVEQVIAGPAVAGSEVPPAGHDAGRAGAPA